MIHTTAQLIRIVIELKMLASICLFWILGTILSFSVIFICLVANFSKIFNFCQNSVQIMEWDAKSNSKFTKNFSASIVKKSDGEYVINMRMDSNVTFEKGKVSSNYYGNFITCIIFNSNFTVENCFVCCQRRQIWLPNNSSGYLDWRLQIQR